MSATPSALVFPTRFGHAPESGEQTAYGLSPRLTSEARRRLAGFALALTATAAVGVAMSPTLPGALGMDPSATGLVAGMNAVGVLVNGGLWRLARSSRLSDSVVLDLGLLWQVIGCLAVNWQFYWLFMTQQGFAPPVTPVVLWMTLQPVLVPTPLRRVLITALSAAAMAPLGLALALLTSDTELGPLRVADAAMMPTVAGFLAVYVSRVVHRMAATASTAERLGSYRLENRLGVGGMGEVWRASHAMLTRPAAVKLIRPEVLGGGRLEAADAVLTRFEEEAKTTALLRSPHTVEVFDFGRADDGRFYYVMELLDGVDLATLVREFGPQPCERVAHILRQVCHSLDEAHSAGLVHRDIKPANIYVCRYGLELDFVKVLDFGLVQARRVEDPRRSGPRVAVGTPAFMAPEAAGSGVLDGRADLYGLGCVAYLLLTGRPVFEGENPLETILMHTTSPPEPPSRRSPNLHAGLEALVLECLRKDPDERIQSARLLRQRLDELEFSEPWSRARAQLWWQAQHERAAAALPASDAGSAFEPTMPVPGLASR